MPINYKLYPENWKDEIRPAILKRANYRCEKCGVRQRAVGFRDLNGKFIELDKSDKEAVEKSGKKFIQIFLSIAHINHNIEDNRFENLKAYCQKCHNNHDKEFRKTNRISKTIKKS